MLNGFIIMLREGLEAALIVGILLAYLHRIERRRYSRYVWLGVGAAVGASLLTALAFSMLAGGLEGTAEQLFEGTAMMLAVAVLTYMLFWMRAQSRSIAGGLRANVDRAIQGRHAWGLTLLAFVTVFREGAESVLFLGTAALSSPDVLAGGLLGIGVTVGLAYLLFATARRLDLRRFFTVTGALLIVFAAGLFAQGLHEFQEAGALPAFVEHLWDTSAVLPDDSPAGSLLKGLVGYSASPSLLMVAGYLGYWAVVATAHLAWKPGQPAEGPAEPKGI